MGALADVLASVYSDWGVQGLRLLGEGLENRVYAARTRAFGPVAIRVPRERWYMNDNDQGLDSRALLRQEAVLAEHMGRHGVPVPTVYHLHESEELDFLVSELAESDGSQPDPVEMGRATRALHNAPVPDGFAPVGLAGGDLPAVLAERISRRAQVVERLAGVTLDLPSSDQLKTMLAWSGARRSVLHMDMRPANLLTHRSAIAAVIDWSNALVGDPALELARIEEYGHLSSGFREGYGEAVNAPRQIHLVYRLDTAIMLAVVFLSEAPNPGAARAQVDRVKELCARLR